MTSPDNIQDAPDVAWTAQWIWQQDAGPVDTWMRFRKKISLSSAPKSAIARIAVDSKYWLFVNGEMVVREGGVKRGPTRTSTWFDIVDLAPHLRSGENTIAVLVSYWGKLGFSHNCSGQGGLLFELKHDQATLISDRSWRASVHPAFSHAPDPQPNWRLPEQNVRFDARGDDPEWMKPEYDDRSWPSAVEKGKAPCQPWGDLWPRSIPQWKDFGLVWIDPEVVSPREKGKRIVAELPYNMQFTPCIDIEAPAGTEFSLRTDDYCGGGGGTDFSVRCDYIAKGGRQTFEAPGWLNGHELHIEPAAGITVHRVGYRESGFACDFTGSFVCSDQDLTSLWSKAQRTLYITMRDTYFDCPDRERAQWWGDAAIEIGETFYSLDRRADSLSRKAILDLVRWQRPDGTLYSPIPDNNWNKELPQQMLASISRFGFGTYLLHSGDTSIAGEVYPAMRRYVGVWKLDKDNLVEHRAGEWDWGDWGENVDLGLLDNIWLWLTLESTIQFARASGNTAHIPAYERTMAAIADAVQRHCWTADEFRSPTHKGPIDDRGNGLAVLTGIVRREQWPTLQKVLTTAYYASPYMEKYVVEALFVMKRPDLALLRTRARYAPMIQSKLSTLWEQWTYGGWSTYNHAWSGGPLTMLSQYVAGIEPTSSGYATFRVQPQPADLKTFHAKVPSVRGMIEVAYQRDDDALSMEVTVPPGSVATVIFPETYGRLRDVRVDGATAAAATTSGGAQAKELGVTLASGRHRLNARLEIG